MMLHRLVLISLFVLAAPFTLVQAKVDLQTVTLGDEKLPTTGKWLDDDTYQLTGYGRDSYMQTDLGCGFAYMKTKAPSFTFQARIVKVEAKTDNTKYGLYVRENLKPTSRLLGVRHDGFRLNECLQWFFRHQPANSTHDGASRIYLDGVLKDYKLKEGFWLKVERAYPTITFYYSEDGKEWKELVSDRRFNWLEQEVFVGLMVTAGGHGKEPITVTFDNVSFKEHATEAGSQSQADFKEFRPSIGTWEMHLYQADTPAGKDTQGGFILKPKDLPWSEIRGLYYSSGSKEVMLTGHKQMAWDSGPQKRRKPSAMREWEGVHEIDDLRYWYAYLKYHKVARLGGAFEPKYFEEVIDELAKQTGQEEIRNLPIVATGGSFAGGITASLSNQYPERFAANAPVIIGAAGWDTENEDARKCPRLYVFGEQDGPHLKDIEKVDQTIRQQGNLWGHAPQWRLHHRWWRTDQIVLPYFMRCLELRLPEKFDASKERVQLKELKEEDGWIGLHENWQSPDSNYVTILPFKDATEAQRRGDASWLPDELTARIWQAFLSNRPPAVIHFPRFDGNQGFMTARPDGREIHYLEANKPWPLLASGPKGDNVKVEYFAGLKKLKVQKMIGEDPYNVILEPLEPGMHAIYLKVTVDDKPSLTHPHPILFQKRD